MRVFHFVNRKFGLEDLSKRRLKIATIADLNDPFELLGPSSPEPDIRRRFLSLKNNLAVNRGMLCFSRNWRNPVQWSHYAERHRGLCLGFQMPSQCLAPVTYKQHRIEPNIAAIEAGGADAEKEMRRVLTTKYKHWKYENELRAFVTLEDSEGDNYFFDFSESLVLNEVIVGHSSTITRQELCDALGDLTRSVSMFKARLSSKHYKVVRQRNEKLWS